MENAKKNLVFYFEGGRHAALPQKLVVKCLEFVCFILLVDKISFSFLRVSLIYGSQRPKPFLWFRPKTNIKSKNGCNFWADTETNQNQQIQVKEHFFKSNIVLKFDVR